MGAKMTGLGRQAWVQRMLEARRQLNQPPTQIVIATSRSKMDIELGNRPFAQTNHLHNGSEAAKGLLPFFPESLLGRQARFGRRWSVMQAFAYGGAVDDILQRASEFDRRRSLELGVPLSKDIEGDRRYLRDESGFYARELKKAGWTVLRWEQRWVVEPPAAAAGGTLPDR